MLIFWIVYFEHASTSCSASASNALFWTPYVQIQCCCQMFCLFIKHASEKYRQWHCGWPPFMQNMKLCLVIVHCC
ncbi:hypothetical protein HRI_001635800 [Hibiscus trionum]|uniref:Secreted protein n=1 Tax=Hibiscus trionum TaxID=183268 RepID=A0A9W7HKV4_HIBTR|nr:hypothetical protein HRI_001635800 [Hibiscus trionum]